MKVVHLCKGTGNGGFTAAWRLHEALLAAGVQSQMVVRERNGRNDLDLLSFDDNRMWHLWFRLRGGLSRMLHRVLLGKNALQEFYLQWIPTFIPRSVSRRLKPDILHVHAPDDGLWALSELAKWDGPIVWTFHTCRDFSQGYLCLNHRLDKWLAAGGVGSIHDRDERLIAGLNGVLKKRMMSTRRDACIAPSHFTHQAGRVSGVFDASRHFLIRNCVPLDVFRDEGREDWRNSHGLDENAFVVLAGAQALDSPIKGFDLFVEAMSLKACELRERGVVVALFGGGSVPQEFRDVLPVIELGYVNEESLKAACSGCDLFVVPSREDNFPNVVIEALACGLPYVGFDTGGVGDMVRLDDRCGKVVARFDKDALGEAILDFAKEPPDERKPRREACRRVVEIHCGPQTIARQHIEVYQDLYTRDS